jgi:hypothetical protein
LWKHFLPTINAYFQGTVMYVQYGFLYLIQTPEQAQITVQSKKYWRKCSETACCQIYPKKFVLASGRRCTFNSACMLLYYLHPKELYCIISQIKMYFFLLIVLGEDIIISHEVLDCCREKLLVRYFLCVFHYFKNLLVCFERTIHLGLLRTFLLVSLKGQSHEIFCF